MKSSYYLALVLFVTVVTADDSRSKKEAIYNPYGQTTDANKYLGAAVPAGVYGHTYRGQLPYDGHRPAAQPAHNQPQYYQQQPHQRAGARPYNGDIVATAYGQYNSHYPYSGGGYRRCYPYNVDPLYPYSGAYQQYPYSGAYQQYPYSGAYQQYPYNVGPLYPYNYGYQNAYGRLPNPSGYTGNNYGGHAFGQAIRQAPAYPSAGAQPISPPVPHPFYHAQGTYYPTTTTEASRPTAAAVAAPVEPPKKPYN